MKPQVLAKLEDFLKYPLFETVGQPLPDSVAAVRNWTETAKLYETRKWQNCRLMASNALARFVYIKSWNRGQEWNPLSDELRPQVLTFVDARLPKTSAPESLREKLRAQLAWDILLICLEHEFRDVVAPFFYLPLLL
jgi:hypothetical protein